MGPSTGVQPQGFAAPPEEQPTIWEAPKGRCGSAGSNGSSVTDAAGKQEQAAAREEWLRTQMGSAVYEEHLEARQAAAEGRLQLYRAQVHERQRALLEPDAAAAKGVAASSAQAGGARDGESKDAATDKAMATMQLLVAHLVAKDVAPPE